MRGSEIRKELESYGISTKSFFEKSEMVDALKKARAEGKTPVDKTNVDTETEPTSTSSSKDDKKSRDDKLAAEMEKCKKMKVGELKKELKDRGISTKSFFEKSEFVKALAEARVDGVKKAAGRGRAQQRDEEPFDPSYRDVVTQKFRADPLLGRVIDVRLGK